LTRERYERPSARRAPTSRSESEAGSTATPLQKIERPSARALLRRPLAWLSLALFFVYVGVEVVAGQWSFSLFTLARDTPTTIGGVLISAYWGSLTVGRLIFGAIATRLSSVTLLRGCMALAVMAAALIWLNVPPLSWFALAILGFALAPIFPVLIAETPARLGSSQTANAIGFQVAAAVLGGAALPAGVGILAARLTLEIVAPCLLALGLVQLALHEALLRRAFEPR
jgi:fucose permease